MVKFRNSRIRWTGFKFWAAAIIYTTLKKKKSIRLISNVKKGKENMVTRKRCCGKQRPRFHLGKLQCPDGNAAGSYLILAPGHAERLEMAREEVVSGALNYCMRRRGRKNVSFIAAA